MSSHSYDTPCPNCQKEMYACSDSRPFDKVSGECPYCGFAYYTKSYQMDLEELNDLRADQSENNDGNFKPLKKLPKYDQDLIC